ncbi:GMC oxidoreductase [Rhodococcus tukisamuensis]|uniref:Cholesterol oxidase n=1 Tax=Rhodococcus tukisamuensis TaxID=168276 RepID=A0A1G6T1A8_9NOCA|nr:GMC oxidoreductase [Rhodococcus tukisamuensis]SDD22267.1 cholesterol oxidase [Rhodococcus tukisamuensis]
MTTAEFAARVPHSRRSVLRGAALSLGAIAAGSVVGPLASAQVGAGPTALRGKTAVVVGSGFGGAVAALRLGQAGVQTTVLERGRRWPIDPAGNTFCAVNEPDHRAAWFADQSPINPLTKFARIDRYPGLIDRVKGNGIDALYGSGVGGGSLAFGAFTPQPRRKDFTQVFPAQIDYDELDRTYYPRARKMLGTSPLPADLLAHPNYRGARAWLDYIEDFGGEPVLHDFCVNWDVVRDELAGRRPASYSIGEGPYGTNSGAKNSVDHNYLPAAEATGNVSILPLHEVVEIREVPGQDRFEVSAKRIDETGAVLEHKTIVADFVFMAAGSFYTSSLLATAKAKGTLTRLNDEVGKGYGTNGDFLMSRVLLRRDCGAKQGGPGVAVMYDDDNPDGPISISWEASPFPDVAGGGMMANLIQVITDERGSVDYNPATGRAELNYPFGEANSDVDARGRNFAGRFHERTEVRQGSPATGIPVYTRLSDFGSGCTWHGLGGAVMGQACDFEGKVDGYSNLFVVDGALLPGSTALVNPALTITAVAERCLDRFVQSRS